jgi:hypothetical protein
MCTASTTAIGLRVDPQDNVWTIDAAASQVLKFDTTGRVTLVLGRKPENITVRPHSPRQGEQANRQQAERKVRAQAEARRRSRRWGGGGGRAAGSGTPGSSFSQPSDVAWDRAGNIYVADGLGSNNRVAKFDKDGRFIAHWGSTGSGQGQFMGVRAIAIDAQGQRVRRGRRGTSESRSSTRRGVQVRVFKCRDTARDVHDARLYAVPLHLARGRRGRHGRRGDL